MRLRKLRATKPALAAVVAALLITTAPITAAVAATGETAAPCEWETYNLTGTVNDELCDDRQAVAEEVAATASNLSFAVSTTRNDDGTDTVLVNGTAVAIVNQGEPAEVISTYNQINSDYMNGAPEAPAEPVEAEEEVEATPVAPVEEEAAPAPVPTPAPEAGQLPLAVAPANDYVPARDTICISDFEADTVNCNDFTYRELAPATVPADADPLPANISAPHVTLGEFRTDWDYAAPQGHRADSAVLIDPSSPSTASREYEVDFNFFNTFPQGGKVNPEFRVVGFYGETLNPSAYGLLGQTYTSPYEGLGGTSTHMPEYTLFGVDADLSDNDFTSTGKNITAKFTLNPTGTVNTDGVLNAVMYEARIFAVIEVKIGEDIYQYTVANAFGDYSQFLADLAHFTDVVCEPGEVCNGGEVWGLDLSNQHTTTSPRGPEIPVDGGTGEGNSAWASTTCSIVDARVVDGQLVSEVQFNSSLDIPAELNDGSEYGFDSYTYKDDAWGSELFTINMFNPEVTPLTYMWTVFNTALSWSLNGEVVSDTPVDFSDRTYVVSDDFTSITATTAPVTFTAPYNGESEAVYVFEFHEYLDPAFASCSKTLETVTPPVVTPPVVVPPVVEPPTVVTPPVTDTPVVDEPLAKTGLDSSTLWMIGIAGVGIFIFGGALFALSRRATT